MPPARAPVAVVIAGLVAVAGIATVGIVADRIGSGSGIERRPIEASSIVMFGDSITAEGDWDQLLPDRSMVNQGHPAFTTAQLLPIAIDVADDNPAIVFVLTGTNDVRDGVPPTQTRNDLAAILDVFAEASPDTRVVVQTVLPRAATATEIVDTNVEIVRLAAERGLEVLDLHREFDDGTGGLRADETRDGWHLSDQGYRRWARLLDERLTGP